MDVRYERVRQYSVFENNMDPQDPFSSLMLIDLMVTELCNRVCEFCPRSKEYPNQNLHMSADTIALVAKQLQESNYKNRILICGFGEPLLWNNLDYGIRVLREKLPHNKNIHMVTNGDRLTEDKVLNLFDAGLNRIYLSLYDGPEQREHFSNLFEKLNIDKDCYFMQEYWHDSSEDYGFVHLSNRAGSLFVGQHQGPCNVPFYSMTLNYDGKVHLCSHDWNKSVTLGDIHQQSIKQIWLESPEFQRVRKELNEKRESEPCRSCNIIGTLYGDKSKETLNASQLRKPVDV
jgi:radical SAM protein with 4Fe4S-binding SPASM domain